MHRHVIETLKKKLELAGLHPIDREAELSTRILRERLETVLPWAMETSGIDCWILVSRENAEDPILRTMLAWDMPSARRVSALLFSRDPATGAVRRMSVGANSPQMNALYENAGQPGEPFTEAIARLVRSLDPERIAVNRSRIFGFCDGLSSTLEEELRGALGPYAQRICDGEDLGVRWLQRATPLEIETMRVLTAVTHDIIDYTMSEQFIVPGVTTTSDVEWEMRRIIHALGHRFWFGPDVDLQRRGSSVTRMFGETILPGDLVHCDIGIRPYYVHLHTDMQWVAYVLAEGEREAPESLQKLLDQGNRFRDIVRSHMIEGRSGNEVFSRSVQQADAEGIEPMLYTHPLGTFGHGAGPSVGNYNNQGFIAGAGERPIEDSTCYALELNVAGPAECWDGQHVFMYLEEVVCKDGPVEYLDGHQQNLRVIRG